MKSYREYQEEFEKLDRICPDLIAELAYTRRHFMNGYVNEKEAIRIKWLCDRAIKEIKGGD